MNAPIVSVRAELVRAAMHFVAKSEFAKAYPERAGVRFEPTPKGVLIISMDDDALLVLRDSEGQCDRASTIRIAPSLFKTAMRHRELACTPNRAILNIGGGEARLLGVTMHAAEITLPFPDWRKITPQRATCSPPAIDPRDAERVAIVAGILAGMREGDAARGVRYSGVDNRDVALASFTGWPDAYAVVATVPEVIVSMPWQRPIWTVGGPMTEARAS